MGLSTVPICRIFPSVVCSSICCMDDGIIHSSLTSMDVVHGRLHCSLIDNFHGRPYYRPNLSKETLLVSLVIIPDIVHSWSWTIPMDELEMY